NHPEAAADESLIVDEQDADHVTTRGLSLTERASNSLLLPERERRPDAEAAVLAGARLRPAAEQADALLHPDQAVAGCADASADAVVLDLELDPVRSSADDDLRSGGVRVLERVRQRLLDDPVGGEVDAGRHVDE